MTDCAVIQKHCMLEICSILNLCSTLLYSNTIIHVTARTTLSLCEQFDIDLRIQIRFEKSTMLCYNFFSYYELFSENNK